MASAHQPTRGELSVRVRRLPRPGLLRGDPVHELADAILEAIARFIADRLANAVDIGKAVADIAGARLLNHVEATLPLQLAREQLGHFEHRHRPAGTDVEDLV